MRVKIFNRIIILLCMILLLSGCGQKTNTFPQIEDLSLFGSSVKEAGKLLGINLLDISPTQKIQNNWKYTSYLEHG